MDDFALLPCSSSFCTLALQGQVPELHLIGDAMAPRLLHDAILKGTRAGRRV
jgi:hypothetical protein